MPLTLLVEGLTIVNHQAAVKTLYLIEQLL